MFDYATFHMYSGGDGFSAGLQGLNSRPILQIGLYVSSPRKLVVEDTFGKVIAGEVNGQS